MQPDPHPGGDGFIAVQDVCKSYQIESQTVPALNGVTLKIPQGAKVAITGRSGSGKSTLLHLIGGLDQPSSGKVSIAGVETSSMNDQKISLFRNRTVGFVFQMNNLLPEFSALENVMMPGLIAGAVRGKVGQKAQALLNAVGLQHRSQHRPGELSGGEQQRVAIARALLMEPPLLLADEPTGNLDRKSAASVQDLLFELCAHHGLTLLLVTHDPSLAQSFPQQIVLEDGRLLSYTGVAS